MSEIVGEKRRWVKVLEVLFHTVIPFLLGFFVMGPLLIQILR